MNSIPSSVDDVELALCELAVGRVFLLNYQRWGDWSAMFTRIAP